MQIELELLAPAKNKSIGIAAINCGADAVYIAGPKFGAREAAGNSISDIAELVGYAHKFGAKVFMVVNTILYEEELEQARETIIEAYKIGCDAIIVQDLGILKMDLPPIELYASTQTNIRTPQQAKFLESLGFSRLILARELSLAQIAAIKEVTDTPLESFVHGALCVSYSGQCYLSQNITGRSANRGCCAQACRSNYTLIDSTGREVKGTEGNPLAKDTPILSLKDFNLGNHIPQLVEAGITSFKIEGRLKNESYIKNIVLHYRRKIDEFLQKDNRYKRASYGECTGGFTPNPTATFNRDYTTLFIDGNRGKWRSKDGAKYLGEFIGSITGSGKNKYGQLHFTYRQEKGKSAINNGDGLCFVTPAGEILGARANTCNGNMVATTEKLNVPQNSKIYRNYNILFEKELEKNPPKRVISVDLKMFQQDNGYMIEAVTAEGIKTLYKVEQKGDSAQNVELAKENIRKQLGKSTDIFSFEVSSVNLDNVPFFPASVLNGIRREISTKLQEEIKLVTDNARAAAAAEFVKKRTALGENGISAAKSLSYLANCSNSLSRGVYSALGAEEIAPAYELQAAPQAELMRTKYCIKYEYGLCPNYKAKWSGDKNYRNNLEKISFAEPLYLLNGKNKFKLQFDCANCEMLIIG